MNEPSKGSGEARRALVTGASSGIGAAFAERLGRDGYDLTIVARTQERLDELAQRLRRDHGVGVEVVTADLADPAALREVASRLEGDSRLELLVNNAGFGTFGSFHELDAWREEEEVRLNVLALHRLTRAALPGMVARGHGGIINVASVAGLMPTPYNATYGATKAFVVSLTEAIHEELGGTGVKVQALCPGFTRTEFQSRAGIDAAGIPGFLWMTSEQVVDGSLAALTRGEVIVVPGYLYKAFTGISAAVPRSLLRRAAALATRRYG